MFNGSDVGHNKFVYLARPSLSGVIAILMYLP